MRVIAYPDGAVTTVIAQPGQTEDDALDAAMSRVPGGAVVPAWVPGAFTPRAPATLTRAQFVKAHASLWLRLAAAPQPVRDKWRLFILPLLDYFDSFDPADATLGAFVSQAVADGLLDPT